MFCAFATHFDFSACEAIIEFILDFCDLHLKYSVVTSSTEERMNERIPLKHEIESCA